MIRPFYALKLAQTKLRSKRGMLIASITISSLLFAALITMVTVFSGAEESATTFVKKAGNDRYLVKVSPNIPYEKIAVSQPLSLETIRDIKAQEKKYYDELKQKYKSLGLEYDKSIEISALTPLAYAPDTLPEEQRVIPNWQSPVIEMMNNQKFDDYKKTANNTFNDLQNIGSHYGATGYYKVDASSSLAGIPQLRLIQGGKEDFSSSEPKAGNMTSYGYYTNAIFNGGYGFTDQKLLSRYLLTTDTASLKGVPVVVSAQEAASLFGKEVGIGKEPTIASEKKTWLETIQAKLNGHVYEVCYRNEAEQELLTKIQRDYAEMKSNEGVKDYVKPSLIYQYPTEACGAITVQSDTRSVDEKKADSKREETQKKLGTYIAPAHRLLTFQIVGIQYAQPYTEYTKSVDEYVKSLLVSQDDYAMTLDIPLQMYEALPESMKFDEIRATFNARLVLDRTASDEFTSRVLEFASIDGAREFLDQEACSPAQTSCDKKFQASPYGSNYLILNEIGVLFGRMATIAFPVVLILAAIIIWLTVSRIMADNRKETAVYRAMGAKRRDVALIYVVYIMLVALFIAAVSFALGVASAFAIDYIYGNSLTDIATAAFGIIDDAPRFSLFGLDSPLLLIILGSIMAISLIASIQPLIRNTLRPPVRDMREE